MKQLVIRGRVLAAAVGVALILGSVSPVFAFFNRIGRVEAHDRTTELVWAPSGDTRVVVDGDGDTDLDCYVYDRLGRFLGKDDDLTDYCIVDIHQWTSGNLEVRIHNLGSVWNQYMLSVE